MTRCPRCKVHHSMRVTCEEVQKFMLEDKTTKALVDSTLARLKQETTPTSPKKKDVAAPKDDAAAAYEQARPEDPQPKTEVETARHICPQCQTSYDMVPLSNGRKYYCTECATRLGLKPSDCTREKVAEMGLELGEWVSPVIASMRKKEEKAAEDFASAMVARIESGKMVSKS